MRIATVKHAVSFVPALAVVASLAGPGLAVAAEGTYYVCPGNIFTNTISAKEADARGCKAKEAKQPMTVAAPKTHGTAAAAAPAASRSSDAHVDPQEQRARDADSRRILQDELDKAETQLAALRKEYNNGEPERLGDEKNYQKYLDRVNELKASIARTESDVAALRRELGKQSP
jgi:hypothetical protein